MWTDNISMGFRRGRSWSSSRSQFNAQLQAFQPGERERRERGERERGERERESKIKEFTAHENAADTDQIHFFCLTYKLFLREREKR